MTTIAVVIVTIVLAIALVYFIKILRDIKYISKKAREGTDQLAADIEHLRANAKAKGSAIKQILSYITKFYKSNKK